MTHNFTFRPALPTDAAMIRAFVRATFAKWVPVMGREPLPMTADYDLALQNHSFELAFLGDDLAGVLETVVEPDHLWVETVAVRSDLQGKGLGQLLMTRAAEQARAKGLAELRLLTNAALTSNLQFYAANGFVQDKTEPFRGGFVVWFSKKV
ncbi:MAG: GNAT family N-acetyltransferase [Pseudomonadota bacterium]